MLNNRLFEPFLIATPIFRHVVLDLFARWQWQCKLLRSHLHPKVSNSPCQRVNTSAHNSNIITAAREKWIKI